MTFPRKIPMSSHTSSTTLDSLELSSIFSATPVESPQVSAVPSLDDIAGAIQRKIQSKTVVLLVGLPASGKSTVCKQLADLLNRQGYKSLIYNAGNIRRAMTSGFSDSEFFNPNNKRASQQREIYAKMCLDNMMEDLKANRINVGFLDATNSTAERRRLMLSLIYASGVQLSNVFVLDISCTDKKLLNYNITSKAFNLDYQGCDIATSIADFKKRSEHYFTVYEAPLEEEFADFKNVTCLSIRNGGKTYHSLDKYPENCDAAGSLMRMFVSNYYKLYGERYHAAVDEFYKTANWDWV